MDAFTIRIVSISIVPSAEGALLTSFSARICGLYFNVIAVYAVSVQGLDSLVRFGVAWHFNESETLWSAGKPVLDHFNTFYISELGKQGLESIFRGVVG
jgi:hypothetical protein